MPLFTVLVGPGQENIKQTLDFSSLAKSRLNKVGTRTKTVPPPADSPGSSHRMFAN